MKQHVTSYKIKTHKDTLEQPTRLPDLFLGEESYSGESGQSVEIMGQRVQLSM